MSDYVSESGKSTILARVFFLFSLFLKVQLPIWRLFRYAYNRKKKTLVFNKSTRSMSVRLGTLVEDLNTFKCTLAV